MRIRRKKKVNVIVVIVLLVGLLLIISTFLYYRYNKNANEHNNFTVTEVSIEKETEIRTGPGEGYPVIKKISTEEILKQQKEDSSWIEVLTQDNIVGWIPLWNVVGSSVKSPEERMYERLNNFTILLNPVYTEASAEYNLRLSRLIKKELEKKNIKVILSRESNQFISLAEIERIANENKTNLILYVGMFEDEKSPKGVSLYYNDTENSQLLSRYVEKNLKEKYIYKVNSPQRNDSLAQKINQNMTQVSIMIGNITSNANKNILNEDIYIQQSAIGIKKGVEEYLYYLLKIEEDNNKRKTELLTTEKRGLDIPFYYTNEERFKNIKYGNEGSETISENGDAIISLAMLDKYFNQEKSSSVQAISEWAGNNYYRKGQGTLSTIVPEFAKVNSLKVDSYNSNQMYKVDEALRENSPVLVQFKPGKFGEKITYKVLRGMYNNRYYLNDPLDDNEKLNTYTPFLREDIEKNLLRAWKISK